MKYFSTILFIVVCFNAYSQLITSGHQFFFSDFYSNPAKCGTDRNTFFKIVQRRQWAGITEAPVTSSLGVDSYLRKRQGMGLSINRDTWGAVIFNKFLLKYAYHIPIKKSRYKQKTIFVSFGISASISTLQFDKEKLTFANPNDPVLSTMPDNKMLLGADAGFLLYGSSFGFGISFPHLLEYFLQGDFIYINEFNLNSELWYFYQLSGKRKIQLRSDVNWIQNYFFQPNVGLNFIFDKSKKRKMSYYAGLSVGRSFSATIPDNFLMRLTFGTNVYRDFHITYTFEISNSRLFSQSYGNHLVLLGLYLKSGKKHYCPAYIQ